MPRLLDIVATLLAGDRRRAGVLLLRLVALAALLMGGVALAGRSLGLRPTELEISANPKLLLQRSDEDGGEFLLVVSPQHWNPTGIHLQPGDSVEIRAHGSVNISLNGVADAARARRAVEARLRAEYVAAHGAEPDTTWLPERHYTEGDRAAILPSRGWTDPGGYSGSLVDHRYPARTRSKVSPTHRYGMLLASITPGEPERYNGFGGVFPVGMAAAIRPASHGGGQLWLVVNDVWDDADPDFPEKFYIDNVGHFVVAVRIRRGE